MVHLYTGDGKGKTTAAVGLAVRCRGGGGKVLFVQFLKSGDSREISMLEKIGIEVCANYPFEIFLWNMNQDEIERCKELQKQCLDTAFEAVSNNNYDMVVLDECIGAIQSGIIQQNKVLELINNSSDTEIILTGRDASDEIKKASDYITEMVKHKHPFDNGTPARAGIEF